MKEIIIRSTDALDEAAREFMAEMGDETVYTFTGEMGAGKTTFINALCRALGVEDDPTGSPTFAIVNEYRSDTTADTEITTIREAAESILQALTG